jgi:hypothetical protein
MRKCAIWRCGLLIRRSLVRAQVGEPAHSETWRLANVPLGISIDRVLRLLQLETKVFAIAAALAGAFDLVDRQIDAFCYLLQPRICPVIETLKCLKKYGQRLDLEIAKEMGLPLALVRQRLAGLAATGAVITCSLTRFENGKQIDAWQCRVSGYVPPLAPGRKAKATT